MATIIDSHFGESALQVEVSEGLSIEGIVRQCEIPEAIWSNVVIVLNGIEVARDEWDSVYPVQSDVISVHVVPLGGGDGKQILRLVAIVAIAVAANVYGPSLGAALLPSASAGVQAGIGAAAITIVGTLAVNALIPPPTIRPNVPGGSATSNAYFLSGQSNRARPYEIVPIVYGQHKLFGNLASAPHIFSAGTSSIFQAVYDFGLGNCSIADVKVGDTPITLFKNQRTFRHVLKPDPVSATATSAFEPIDLQIYNFPIKSVDLSVGLNEIGDFGITTTHPECHTAVVEITFPQGLARFDDQGQNQTNNVKFKIGYKEVGGPQFGPLPSGTQGYAGDDHLSFDGIGVGDPEGPVDDNGDPIYEPKIYFASTKINAGEQIEVRVDFTNGNKAFYGNDFSSENPERPKESFWWERVDAQGNVVETYQQTNVINGLDTDIYDPTKWAYNQEPESKPGFTDAFELGDYAASGTLVADNPPINQTLYAFKFVAPDKEGDWRLKMDLYEWWSKPYNTGGERCAKAQGTFKYARWWNTQNANIATLKVDTVINLPDGQSYEDDNTRQLTYIQTFLESDVSIDGPWTELPYAQLTIFYQGEYMRYNEAQRQYVIDNIKGDVVKIADERESINEFDKWQAEEFSAVIDAGAVKLINEGVLQPIMAPEDMRTPRFINIPDGFDPDPLPEQDEYGSFFTVYGSEATAGKITIVIPMPSVGSYEIRLARTDDLKTRLKAGDPDTDFNRFIDSASWTRIGSRGFPSDESVFNLQHRHSLLEVEFEAAESIQGNVQEINSIVTSRIRRLNSSLNWITPQSTESDNPSWVVLDILTGWSIQNRRAPRWKDDHCGWLHPNQLDLKSFWDFAQHCKQQVTYQVATGEATRNRYAINMVIASDAPIIETCQNILGQCRAQLIITQAGKIGVMLDEARTTPRQLFTPSNSWEFSGSRSFTEIPHAFNVQFTSPELGWQQATVVVYRPGYDATGSGTNEVATLFEDLDTVGITNPHQAQLYGAYMMSQALVRHEIFTLNVDTENLVCQRGDLVQVAHDAPLMGGRSCVITGIEGGWLHISERFDVLSTDNNRYTLRADDGTIYSGTVSAIDDDKIKISNQSNADVGNLIVIGAQNLVTEDYLIQSIRPKPDMTAELSLVKYDSRVYEVDNGTYPVWSPNFSQNDLGGGTQTVTGLTGTSTLVYKDRQPYTKAVLNWGVSPDNDSLAGFYIEWQRAGASNRESLGYVASGTRTFTHEYSSRSSVYGNGTYYVVPYSSLGYKGKEGSKYLTKKIDTTAPVIKSFKAEFTASGNTLLTWTCDDIDIQGFTIYYKASATLPLGKGEVIGVPAYNKREWLIEGAKEGMFWIVATDTSGNNSDPAKDGSYGESAFPTPSLVQPFGIRLSTDKNSGELYWKPLVNEAIDYYSLYRADGLVPNTSEATFLGNVSHLDVSEQVFPVANPYGYFFITATNVFGITGPANSYNSTYPTPGAVQNFRLWVEQGLGVLKWDLLNDPTITVYQLRYSDDKDETNPDAAVEYGSTDGNTNAYPSEKLEGSFFIRAKNRWGIYGPWTRTTSTFEGLGIIDAYLTQSLRFINRYPFSDVTIKWRVRGDESLISRYRVYFYPTDPRSAIRFEDGELVAERPPVLVYEGQERECLTTVSTTEDTGRQHGIFIIQVISIYGTPGDEASLGFQVIKDTHAPVPPERFFVNIVGNTNADMSWLASQSIDVDTYDLRYTPEYASPRWEAAEHIATVGYNVTGYQTNARTGVYMIRATDTSGNVSDVVYQRTTVAELPDMNVIERVEDAPDWLGKKVYFAVDGSRLLMDNAPYTGGDEFGAEPYREAFYYYHERLDLGRIYETRLTAKLQAYGQLEGSVMADWPTLAEIDPISGVKESADWDCWVEYRTGTEEDVIADWVNMVDQDPISGSIASDWTDWRAFFAADVTARFIDFRIVARAYNPNAEVGVISGLVEVDMPDRYWTKSDIPVGVAGASVSIDPPFKHLEAVAVTVDGNDYNVRAVVSDKKPSGFDVKLIDQTNGQAVAGQIDVFCSGYGIEAPEVI